MCHERTQKILHSAHRLVGEERFFDDETAASFEIHFD